MESSLLGDCQFGHNDLGEHQVNKFVVAMKDTDFSNLLIKSQLIGLRLMTRQKTDTTPRGRLACGGRRDGNTLH